MVKAPTHKDGHLLDLGLTDMAEVETACVLLKVMDHNMVRFTLNLSVPVHTPRGRWVYEYKKAPWQVICKALAIRDWSWTSFSI